MKTLGWIQYVGWRIAFVCALAYTIYFASCLSCIAPIAR